MAYSIASLSASGLEQLILVDANSKTQVAVLPAYGAMLHAFTVATRKGPLNIIDNYPDKTTLDKQLAGSYKSSKLSPFVCRLEDGRYSYQGKTLEFEKKFMDGSAIHGLLYNKPFTLVDQWANEEGACVSFQYNYKAEDPGYPFNYRCEIRYTLTEGPVLELQTTITNMDASGIPMADGWHPYFVLGGRVNEWILSFASDSMVEFDDKLIPTGRLVPFEKFSIPTPVGDISLDNCFALHNTAGKAACTLLNESNGIQLQLSPDAAYPYLQLYIPPERNSIAIENLSSAPNAFNNKMGLLELEPRQLHRFTVRYAITGTV